MIANIAWKATNTVAGIVPTSGMSAAGPPLRGEVRAAEQALQAEELRTGCRAGRRPMSLPKAIE